MGVAIVNGSGIPIGMRPDKLRRSRVTFRNGQNDADEGADRRDIPAGGEPRLSAAPPQEWCRVGGKVHPAVMVIS